MGGVIRRMRSLFRRAGGGRMPPPAAGGDTVSVVLSRGGSAIPTGRVWRVPGMPEQYEYWVQRGGEPGRKVWAPPRVDDVFDAYDLSADGE